MGLSRMSDEVQASHPSEDWGLKRASHWDLKFCWLPKRCFLTNTPLWGKYAYYGERWITGPGEPIVEHYWIEKHEFILWQIKGTSFNLN